MTNPFFILLPLLLLLLANVLLSGKLPITTLTKFIGKHWENIYIVIWFLFMFLVIQVALNYKFVDEKKKKGKKEKIITKVIESMKSSNKKVAKDICNSNNVPKACAKIGKAGQKACNTLDCCVWAKSKAGTFCVEGDQGGADLDQDKKGNKWIEYYYYLNKKYKIDDK
jgi:hypothetical protein